MASKSITLLPMVLSGLASAFRIIDLLATSISFTDVQSNSAKIESTNAVTATKTVLVTITAVTCPSLTQSLAGYSLTSGDSTARSPPSDRSSWYGGVTEDNAHKLAGCTPNCVVVDNLRPPTRYTWSELQITSTFTAATVVTIINQRLNSTKTSTIFNPVPSDVTPPHLNSLGTQIDFVGGHHHDLCRLGFLNTTGNACWWPFSDEYPKDLFTIAYPTSFVHHPISTYTWLGQLPTTEVNQPDVTICSTAWPIPAVVKIKTPPQPSQTGFPGGVASDDPRGYHFTLVRDFSFNRDLSVLPEHLWPEEAAMRYCEPNIQDLSPAIAGLTAAWTTVTSTQFEGDGKGKQSPTSVTTPQTFGPPAQMVGQESGRGQPAALGAVGEPGALGVVGAPEAPVQPNSPPGAGGANAFGPDPAGNGGPAIVGTTETKPGAGPANGVSVSQQSGSTRVGGAPSQVVKISGGWRTAHMSWLYPVATLLVVGMS